MCCYSFGRRLPRWQHRILAAQPLVPVLRGAFVRRVDAFEPVCGWRQWREWERWLRRREGRVTDWVHVRSQWGKVRSSGLGLGRMSVPQVFVTVEPQVTAVLHPTGRTGTFRVPALRDRATSGRWLLRSFDPVPRFHRTPRWDPVALVAVAQEASQLLDKELTRPEGIPAHWRPMHGDFVPWNLREDRAGVLWLIDWENAGWAPPWADVMRYAVAYQSIFQSRPEEIVRTVLEAFRETSPDVMAEAALFWTAHPNLQRPEAQLQSKGQMGDYRRSQVEHAALMQIVAFR
jgi:hypothetical protein